MKKEKIIAGLLASALCLTPVSLSFGSAKLPSFTFSAQADDVKQPNVEKYSLGDVNGDELIDADDASAILSEYSAVSTGNSSTMNADQKKAADINSDTLIDADDSSAILSYYSYLSTGGKLSIQKYLASQGPQIPTVTTSASTTAVPKTTTVRTTAATKTTNAKTTALTTKSTTVKTTAATTKAVTTVNSTRSTTTATSTKTPVTTTATKIITGTKVQDIRITRSEMSVNINEGELAAYVTMLPNSALNKSEIWSSSDESIAIVDNEGWVIGLKEGSCTITVKSADNPDVSADITCTVIDNKSVKDIRITRDTMTMKVGYGELAARVTMLPETAFNKGEIWSSSNEEVAVVDNEGWVSAKKAGNTIVTVQSADNPAVFAMILVTVIDPETTVTTQTSSTTSSSTTVTTTASAPPATAEISEIHLSKYKMTISVGACDISMVTMFPANAGNKDEIWVSSDTSIATVDKYGWVKGISEGKCTVTVYSADNPSVKAEIAVTVITEAVDITDETFSYIAPGKSDATHIAFKTPLPADVRGRYIIDYVITDANGTVTTISTPTLLIPEMKNVITRLTADTNEFSAVAYLTNLTSMERVKMGSYKFVLSPRDAKTESEDIRYAFDILSGTSE